MKKTAALLLFGSAAAAAAAAVYAGRKKKESKYGSAADQPFYLIRNGAAVTAFVLPNAMYAKKRLEYTAVIYRLLRETGVAIPILNESDANAVQCSRIFAGEVLCADYSLMGDASSYQYAVLREDRDLYLMAHTESGRDAALSAMSDALVISEDKKNVYLPASALGLFDWDVPEVVHAFKKFTVTGYGCPSFSSWDPEKWNDKDREVLQSLLDFGITEYCMHVSGDFRKTDDAAKEQIRAVRAFITKLYEDYGITCRLYGIAIPAGGNRNCDYAHHPELVEDAEANVKFLVEAYGDLPGLSHWGFFDEPEPEWKCKGGYECCALYNKLFDKYDPRSLPLYVNMGPVSGQVWAIPKEWYDELEEQVNPDFYCFDRYPFFVTDEGGRMTDTHFYANLELNRDYAIDNGRDAGIITAICRVGGDGSDCCDITQDFMNWQINLMLAYHHRYLEHFVFYTGHAYGPYTKENEKTFRWEIGRKATAYALSVGNMLLDKRLDAVFHLPNADGSHSAETIAYYPYRNAGEVLGCDAVLSFFDDGTIIVTDKRCQHWDGAEHDVTLTGLTGELEWFDAAAGEWAGIASCPAFIPDNLGGVTLRLTRSSQYILREIGS